MKQLHLKRYGQRKNCQDVNIHSSPCKHLGWWTKEVTLCDLLCQEVPHWPPGNNAGNGIGNSIFPKGCPHRKEGLW